jgi:hypothetical protein
MKFLGLPISDSLDSAKHRNAIEEKLIKMLNLLESAHLRRKQKLKVYSIGIYCPRLAWLAMIPITWIERNLNPITTSYLKKWAGLARCATPSILHLMQRSKWWLKHSISSNLLQEATGVKICPTHVVSR